MAENVGVAAAIHEDLNQRGFHIIDGEFGRNPYSGVVTARYNKTMAGCMP